MELRHNKRIFELFELKEPQENATSDIIAIFELEKDEDNILTIKSFVNWFYGASDKNFKKIALDYIKEYCKSGKTKTPKTTRQKAYARIKEIIKKLGDDKNEQDTCELVEELEQLLPFENEKEHNAWTDLTITFKCWEDWESATLEIAQRLNK